MKNFQYYLEKISVINETNTLDYPDAEKKLGNLMSEVTKEKGMKETNWSSYKDELESISKHPKSSYKFLKHYGLIKKNDLKPADIFATIKEVAKNYAKNYYSYMRDFR